MVKLSRVLVVIPLLFWISSLQEGFGMRGNDSSQEIVAKSDDGKYSLIKETTSGPEGGSSTSYFVAETSKLNTETDSMGIKRIHAESVSGLPITLSDTLSIGSGSSDEKISATECKSRNHELKATLEKFNFSNFSPSIKECKNDSESKETYKIASKPASKQEFDQFLKDKIKIESTLKNWESPRGGAVSYEVKDKNSKRFLVTIIENESNVIPLDLDD